ncbi:hypothetical protein BDQ12DRAFT_724024 [Crucibulum laeve]|uniref:Uncharacterized protein n=1 Tax=Crucibulum laeve TaxID=68775 RepID=A0A5C3M8V8_9AGAR|nr:hypothetical protein BDQ12DRAFT_724024 [Crucibulum laeve]
MAFPSVPNILRPLLDWWSNKARDDESAISPTADHDQVQATLNVPYVPTLTSANLLPPNFALPIPPPPAYPTWSVGIRQRMPPWIGSVEELRGYLPPYSRRADTELPPEYGDIEMGPRENPPAQATPVALKITVLSWLGIPTFFKISLSRADVSQTTRNPSTTHRIDRMPGKWKRPFLVACAVILFAFAVGAVVMMKFKGSDKK